MQWFALQFMCLTSFFDFLRSLRDFRRFKQEKFDTAEGIVLGGLAALLLMLLRLKKRKSAFAYGPYFALTALTLFLMRSV